MTRSGLQPDSERLAWLRDFRKQHGRAPRILHVGNIANNGYNNAKVLNDAGFDCDVICYDYYHIMGCPEWEDADFDGQIADHFAPNFRRVALGGFARPRWFSQGKWRHSVRYLLARRRGRRLATWWWWNVLAKDQVFHATGRVGPLGSARRTLGAVKRRIPRRRHVRPRAVAVSFLNLMPWPVRPAIIKTYRALRRITPRMPERGRSTATPERVRPRDDFDQRVDELVAEFALTFPSRADQLTPEDLEAYRDVAPIWHELFREYDLIEAYSTDPILPMITGDRPVVAYEHGTIREIPFETTATGRLTALAYRVADMTIITNPDCAAAADRLGITRRRFVPHLIDHKYYLSDVRDTDPRSVTLARPYIFCPARHDWSVKGTDILLRAFARIAPAFPEVRLVTPAWGGDLDRSRALIAESGLSDRMEFIAPLSIHELIRVGRQATVIVDQFFYGVFGGIGPTALALGTPLVTHVDHTKSAWCMTEPPCFDAHDVDTCAAALVSALDTARDPAKRAAAEDTMRRWMQENYWYGEVTGGHADIFAALLTAAEPQPAPIRIKTPPEAARTTPPVGTPG